MKFFKILFLLLLLTNVIVSCRKKRGCTDPEAMNYNPDAKKDDHSCYYYWVGQEYQGGKIFYIDQTGKHGLIAADFDIEGGAPWGCISNEVIGADGIAVGTGLQNTLDIVNGCGEGTAAFLCANLDTLGYDDWYLPSKNELQGLADRLGFMGEANLNGAYYASSSEMDATNLWSVYMPNRAAIESPKNWLLFTRPIRSF